MSDDKVLTKEIAEQFLEDEDSVDLSEFTAIDDDAAEVLSGSEWMLELDGLTTLSDAAAATKTFRSAFSRDSRGRPATRRPRRSRTPTSTSWWALGRAA